jgi:hypothetical protein
MARRTSVMVVDTAVWADYFNGEDTALVMRLEQALTAEEDIALLPLILTEVLQGFRSDSGFARARDLLLALPLVVPPPATHVAAAALFRRLRARGGTIRGTIDCIIAQTCIEGKLQLLSPDIDFLRIAEHTPLDLYRP